MKKYIYILTLLVSIVSAKAQEAMTLELCREKAVEYNRNLKVARLQHEEAIANQKTARTAYLPKVDAKGSAMLIPGVDDISMPGAFLPTAASANDAMAGNFSGQSDVWMPGISLELGDVAVLSGQFGIQMPVYAGGKIRYSNKMADIGVDIYDENFRLKYSEIVEQTDQAFWNVVAMKENVKLAAQYVEMLTELEEQMADMYELGLVPASEKLKVTVQKNKADLGLIKAKNGLRLTKMALNQLMGFELKKEIEVMNTLEKETEELPNFTGGLISALQNRPELKMLEGQLGLKKYDKKMVEADYLPQLGVGVNHTYSYINKLTENGSWNTIAAVQVSIPVFHWQESKHKKNAAALKIQQAETELDNTRDLIALEVSKTMIELEEAWQTIEIAKKSVEEANENLEETKLSFEVGLNTTTEVLNAQAGWQQAQTNLISSLTQFELLKTTWLRVTGKLRNN